MAVCDGRSNVTDVQLYRRLHKATECFQEIGKLPAGSTAFGIVVPNPAYPSMEITPHLPQTIKLNRSRLPIDR